MLIGWNGAFGSLVWTQNAVTCLCQCNCNPGAGIMLDVAWRQALHCFSWEKTPLVERVSPVCQWQGCDVAPPAHTRGLDVDLISNIQHFNDNLLIKKKKGFSDWILPSKNRQGVQSGRISIVEQTCYIHKQLLTVTLQEVWQNNPTLVHFTVYLGLSNILHGPYQWQEVIQLLLDF